MLQISEIPPAMTTREAMEMLRVRNYRSFNAILGQHGITPAWRGGRGNVYRGSDLARILKPVDKSDPGFHVF